MATLYSEDREFKSSFEISKSSDSITKNIDGVDESWQSYEWKINHGPRLLETINNSDGYLLCRNPIDEVKQLVDDLSHLVQKEKSEVLFEPEEPSLNISVKRQSFSDGLKVQIFIDEGNASTAVSRWDSIGVRFFTTEELLKQFINDLKEEFNC